MDNRPRATGGRPIRLMAALGALSAVVIVRPALAQSFTPIEPARCPSFTEVDWRYSVSPTEWELPTDFVGNYVNHMNHNRPLWANGYVDQMGFRVDAFSTESGFDFLTYTADSTVALSGTPALGWYDNRKVFSYQAAGRPNLNFRSDYSIVSSGFLLGRARVCAEDSTPMFATPPVQVAERNQGVLLGTGDVVYMSAPVGSTKVGESCSRAHDTFVLWGQIGVSNDFDLYVRCNAVPTATAYTYRGFSSDNQEFIHATAADCPCGGTWYIAVHSHRGAGQFNFVQQKHYKHYNTHYTAIMCNANAADFQDKVRRTQDGFKTWFGATEGGWYWDRLHVYDNPQSFPISTTKWTCSTGRAHAAVCNAAGYITLYNGDDARTYAHEIGHYHGCLSDEYADISGISRSRCGHSMMANPWADSSMCHCRNWGGGSPDSSGGCVTGYGDHDRDAAPQFGTPPPSSGRKPVWKKWYDDGVMPFEQNSTPDQFDYVPFDFNGLYPVTTTSDT